MLTKTESPGGGSWEEGVGEGVGGGRNHIYGRVVSGEVLARTENLGDGSGGESEWAGAEILESVGKGGGRRRDHMAELSPSHSVPVPNRPSRLCGRKAT